MGDNMRSRLQAAVAAAVTDAARAAGGAAAVHSYWGATLYHPADLPSAAAFRAALGAKPLRSNVKAGCLHAHAGTCYVCRGQARYMRDMRIACICHDGHCCDRPMDAPSSFVCQKSALSCEAVGQEEPVARPKGRGASAIAMASDAAPDARPERAERLGWLTESSVQPRKRRAIEGTPPSTASAVEVFCQYTAVKQSAGDFMRQWRAHQLTSESNP
jgi:hypothetical protein